MPAVQTGDNRLVEISQPGEVLVVKKRSAPYQSRLLAVAFLFLLTCLLIAIAITATAGPVFRFLMVVLGIAVAMIALRMLDIRSYAAKEEAFHFDLLKDTFARDGQQIAPASEIDHILVRRILRNDEEDPENSDYALVVALQNTKRFTLAESDGVSGARSQITDAANEIAKYLGVPVKQGERLPTEEWMDR
jgi:hypothetical protein